METEEDKVVARHAEFLKVLGGRFTKDCESLETVLSMPSSLRSKYTKIEKVTDETMELLVPFVPCGSGCSHCCKQAVIITDFEANRISEFIKVACRKVGEVTRSKIDAMVQRYKSQPCPFLSTAGTCTIYEVRPFVCRSHHTISSNPEVCDISENQDAEVAKVNLVHLIGVNQRLSRMVQENMSDIREYFGEGPVDVK